MRESICEESYISLVTLRHRDWKSWIWCRAFLLTILAMLIICLNFLMVHSAQVPGEVHFRKKTLPCGQDQSFKLIIKSLESSFLLDLNLSKIGARSNLSARDFQCCFSRLNACMSQLHVIKCSYENVAAKILLRIKQENATSSRIYHVFTYSKNYATT